MGNLEPLLILLLFVPTCLAGGICAVLVLACLRWTRLDLAGAKAIVATLWWVTLSAGLWIGSDYAVRSGKADAGVFFAAILAWIFVVVPGPLLGSQMVRMARAPNR